MGWVRLDDDFYDHPRFAAIDALAIGWWVAGLAWSNRNLTDGRIPKNRARMLLPLDGLAYVSGSYSGEDAKAAAVIDQLESAGLWEDDGTAYVIRDYHQYQRSSDEIRGANIATSVQRSLAGKARVAGAKRDQQGRLLAAGQDQHTQRPTSGDTSEPPSTHTSDTPASNPALQPQLRTTTKHMSESFDSDFEIAWLAYPRHDDRGKALRAYQARRRAKAGAAELLTATQNYASQVNGTEHRYIKLGATFFGPDEPWREWVDPKAHEGDHAFDPMDQLM
jgi:hypothetical protein